jgi:two-component system LytT family response regulator
MYKTLIIDDIITDAKSLKRKILATCPLLDLMGVFVNIEDAQQAILEFKPDLIFINPIIAKKSSLTILEIKQQIAFETIFTAGSEKYSINAIKYQAIDYLVKPYTSKAVQLAGKNALQKLTENQISRQADLIAKSSYGDRIVAIEKIAIPTLDGFVFICISEIVRCEANGAYTMIYTSRKEKVLASKNIKEYEDILPKNTFFRIHNSHIVNLNRIHKYNKGRGGTVIMEDGSHIEVASRRRSYFLELFQ